MGSNIMSRVTALQAIKAFHTLVWVFFVCCILAIPLLALKGQFVRAFIAAGIVLIEAGILIFNEWHCPLTALAARYTDDRRDNFDIYLPLWLARYNKLIFGWLFGAVLVSTLLLWCWR
jgi:hypothetical protein